MPDSTSALINQLTNPPNPFQQFGATLDFANKLKDFQAQKAIADIYGQSIDPTTGLVDPNKFGILAQGNPAALWKYGASQQQMGQGMEAQGRGTSAQVEAAQNQLGAQAAYMQPLIEKAQNGTVTADDVRGVLKSMPPGLVSPTMINSFEQQMANGADPNNWVKGAFFANQHSREILNQAQGPVVTVQQGSQTSFVRPAAPFAPRGISSAPLPQGMTPEQWGHLEPWTDPKTGITTMRPYGEIMGVPKPMGVDAGPGTVVPPQSSTAPPTTSGTSAGPVNREVATNNFAGMRNPNVPAAGGPNANPAGWQQFATPEEGIRAISNQLDRYASGEFNKAQGGPGTPINTLNGIISTWAPASDGNPTAQLVARASKIMGVKPDEPLDLSNPDTKAGLVESMIRNEQGGNLPQMAAAAIPGALNAPNWKPYEASDARGAPKLGKPAASDQEIQKLFQPGSVPGTQGFVPGAPSTTPSPTSGPGYPPQYASAAPPTTATDAQPSVNLPSVSVTAPAPNAPAPPVQVAQAGGGHEVPRPNPFVQPQFDQGAADYRNSMETDKTLGTRTKPLINAIQILRNNPNTPVGPAAKEWTAWATALHDVFGIDVDTSGATTYQELAKQLAQNSNVAAIASSTDLQRLNTAAAQPNPEQSRDAIMTLAAEQIGLERIKSAQYRYFRSLHPGKFPAPDSPEQNTQYFNMETGDWAADQDPMAYGLDFAPQKAINDYLAGLDKNATTRFGHSLNNAKQLMRMNVPTGQ